METKILTSKEAYRAMYFFLDNLYQNTKSDDLGGFLGSMSLVEDFPADPALWEDWLIAIKKAQDNSESIDLKFD